MQINKFLVVVDIKKNLVITARERIDRQGTGSIARPPWTNFTCYITHYQPLFHYCFAALLQKRITFSLLHVAAVITGYTHTFHTFVPHLTIVPLIIGISDTKSYIKSTALNLALSVPLYWIISNSQDAKHLTYKDSII